jgi:DNA-binding NarL/FixJ family response regulator
VILVDDSALFREGLAALLAATDVAVVGQASSCAEAGARVVADRPDVVLMDIRMPPTFTDEGLQAARALKSGDAELGVLLLSAHVELASAARLFEEHSQGIGSLLKDRVDNIRSLAAAVRRVAAGELVLDPEVVQGLFKRRRNARLLHDLNDRERAVLQYMAEGRSNNRIGAETHLSAKTIEGHVASIFTKLGLPPSPDDNRRVLAVLAWMRSQTP